MAVGSKEFILICTKNASLGSSVSPCTDIGGVPSEPTIHEKYILFAASDTYFEGIEQPFDYSLASQLFVFGFTSLILLWWVGIVSGRIIKAIWD